MMFLNHLNNLETDPPDMFETDPPEKILHFDSDPPDH